MSAMPQHLKRESEIQREVVTYFRALGAYVWITSERRAKGGTVGMWDLYLVVLRTAKTAWFECKQPGEKLSAAQRHFADVHDRMLGNPLFGHGGLEEARNLAKLLGLAWTAA